MQQTHDTVQGLAEARLTNPSLWTRILRCKKAETRILQSDSFTNSLGKHVTAGPPANFQSWQFWRSTQASDVASIHFYTLDSMPRNMRWFPFGCKQMTPESIMASVFLCIMTTVYAEHHSPRP